MIFSRLASSIGNSDFLRLLKEGVLQALFPRVCPVCGEILRLPKGSLRLLYSSVPVSSVQRCRPLLICSACYPALTPVSGAVCRKCTKPLFSEEESLCENCRKGNAHFEEGASLWIHDDAAKKILYDLKFHNRRDNADLIGFELALKMKERMIRWQPEVLLPVPLHKKRLQQRGFNQAQLIAEKLSFWLEKLYGIRVPVDASYLLRCENTRPQRTIDAARRSRNVARAFTIREDGKTPYRSVVLLDDIYTSGATINACAGKLKEAGCKQVCFITASIVS